MSPTILVWFPIGITIVVSALVVGAMVTVNRLLGPRPPREKIKGEAFECGNPPSGPAWNRFSIRFYLTALLFLIFDVEIVFLYPWAAVLRQLGIVGFIEAAIFIAILVVGLIYAWQRGALDFE
jgi:NADH:ubiquinone oxidoreductase subunit 3 (subunit A)